MGPFFHESVRTHFSRQLDFVSGAVSNQIFSSSDAGMKGWLDDMRCSGGETRVEFCELGPWDHHDCSGAMDSAVQCGKDYYSNSGKHRTPTKTPWRRQNVQVRHIVKGNLCSQQEIQNK